MKTKYIDKIIMQYVADLKTLALNIHQNPELGFKEKKACIWQKELLCKWGFKIEDAFVGIPTAYKATYGKGKPTFCFMAEYDALPEIGHACGHNLICAAAIGAGKALVDILAKQKIQGTVIVMGTPAEESKGGKVIMVKKGALKGIDAVMLAHPSYRTTIDTGSSAIQRFHVYFRGKCAHAAASPEKGKNALDAVMLLFQGINAWRQQLPESSRIHGIVSEGGVAPNIIPEHTSCLFYLRSPDDDVLNQMVMRFKAIIKGAALMTNTKATIVPYETPYKARQPNHFLNEAYVEAAQDVGLNPVIPKHSGRASSDFGDVSRIVPGVHVYFGIAQKVISAHSLDFKKAATSAYGLEQMLRATQALARVGYHYFTDPQLRKNVKNDFIKKRNGEI